MDREHFLNADFDLSLRPGWTGPGSEAAARRIRDLAFHGVPAAAEGESVVLYEPVPDELGDVLAAAGLELPQVTIHPGRRAGSVLAPFGWNREAVELDRRSGRSAEPPPFEVVRHVNDRRFADRLAAEVLGEDGHVLGIAGEPREVASLVAADHGHADGWIVKARHANAGLGNRRLRRGPLGPADLDAVSGLLGTDEVVTVERWRRRVLDLSATFEVDDRGGAAGAEVHEVVNTADGAFLGAMFGAGDDRVAPWRDAVLETAHVVAGELAAAGYRGPVCLDAFVWRSPSGPRLRRLVDLNARRHMSAGFRRLWRLWGPDRWVYGRLFSTRRLVSAPDLPTLVRELGDDAFDPRTRRGALPTSPLSLAGRRPQRLGVALVGADRREVLALEDRFRRRFEG